MCIEFTRHSASRRFFFAYWRASPPNKTALSKSSCEPASAVKRHAYSMTCAATCRQGLLSSIDHSWSLSLTSQEKVGGMGDARERISGLTFKPVRNARFALGHASRSWPQEPRYLLPPAHRLPNRLVYEAVPEPAAVALFATRKAARSRQAKAAKASPFLEGVLVLPTVTGSDYAERMADQLQAWRVAFETATGCRVLHISMHLDEGYIDQAGQVQRNPHAHVITDRVLSTGKMWKPDRRELADVQTLTAKMLGMQRGQTHQDRKGAPARRHIPHQVYRRMMQAAAPAPQVPEPVSTPALETQNRALLASLVVANANASTSARKAAYGALRAFLKGSGMATQASYQALKALHLSGSPLVTQWSAALDADQLTPAGLLAALRQPAPPKPLGRP